MISDSPYQATPLAMTKKAGAVAGIVAAGAMLALIYALESLSGLMLRDLLTEFGEVALLGASVAERSALIAGLLLVAGMGVLFGILYAACLQRAPTRGIIGVGIFYGFLLWVVGSLLVGALLGQEVRVMLRSWTWLTACLFYGSCLAAASIWSISRQPAVSASFPLD